MTSRQQGYGMMLKPLISLPFVNAPNMRLSTGFGNYGNGQWKCPDWDPCKRFRRSQPRALFPAASDCDTSSAAKTNPRPLPDVE